MRFGADINASTSFDETVYMLQVPTDKPGALDQSMLILEDWAHNVSFDPAEIDKERGVVMEEWRARRGAGARMQDKLLPILLKGSRYADRVPIGKTEILQGFKPERLTKFYADWYRPDLMAVVAVGDFDQAEVEALIKRQFAGLTAPQAGAAARQLRRTGSRRHRVRRHHGQGNDDDERRGRLPAAGPADRNGRRVSAADRRSAVRRHAVGAAGRGLAEARRAVPRRFRRTPAASSRGRRRWRRSGALVKDGGVEPGLEAILAEKERVARFGFTQTELERLKQAVLRSIERIIAEKDNRPSASRADEYVRNFLASKRCRLLEFEYALVPALHSRDHARRR